MNLTWDLNSNKYALCFVFAAPLGLNHAVCPLWPCRTAPCHTASPWAEACCFCSSSTPACSLLCPCERVCCSFTCRTSSTGTFLVLTGSGGFQQIVRRFCVSDVCAVSEGPTPQRSVGWGTGWPSICWRSESMFLRTSPTDSCSNKECGCIVYGRYKDVDHVMFIYHSRIAIRKSLFDHLSARGIQVRHHWERQNQQLFDLVD